MDINPKQNIKPKMKEVKMKTKDYFHILFKSAKDNQFRIKECCEGPQGEIKCNIYFNSYIAFRKYQKRLRRVTLSISSVVSIVIVSTLVIQLMLPVFKSQSATYYWEQGGDTNGWETATPGTVVVHPNPTNIYDSKTVGLSSGSTLTLTQTDASWDQDTDTHFDAVGSAKDNVFTDGTGTGATIKVLRPAGSVCSGNPSCESGTCTTGVCE